MSRDRQILLLVVVLVVAAAMFIPANGPLSFGGFLLMLLVMFGLPILLPVLLVIVLISKKSDNQPK